MLPPQQDHTVEAGFDDVEPCVTYSELLLGCASVVQGDT